MTGWYILGWAFIFQLALAVGGSILLDRIAK